MPPLSTAQISHPGEDGEVAKPPAFSAWAVTLSPTTQCKSAALSRTPFTLITCTGCSLVLVLPIPSMVVTATWCKEQMGAKQALAEKWLEPRIKVIPLSTRVIRVDQSAGPRRPYDDVYHFLHSTLCSFLFHRGPSSPLYPRIWARSKGCSPPTRGLSLSRVLWSQVSVNPRPLSWARNPGSLFATSTQLDTGGRFKRKFLADFRPNIWCSLCRALP